MTKVAILGASLSTGNMGVSALAASLIGLIHEVKPDADIFFFVPGRDSGPQILELPDRRKVLKVLNYRLSPKAVQGEHLFWLFFLALLYKFAPVNRTKTWIVTGNRRLKTLMSMDFIGDIRGGDSFSDIYGLRRFLFGCLPDIIVLLLGKELHLLPQTYGPYKSPIAKRVARYIMGRARTVLSRDREGLNVAKNILGSSKAVLCPDVAFSLKSIMPPNLSIRPKLLKAPGVPLIGINMNGLLYNGGYTRNNMFGLKFDYRSFVHALVARLLDTTNAHILLVPHTFAPDGHVESDNAASAEVLNAFSDRSNDRLHLVEGQYDQFRIKGVIGLCDFLIGSRMHACIAALSQGIPTVGVAYSRKFRGVFDTIDTSAAVLDATEIEMDAALVKICSLFQERDKIKSSLETRVEDARAQLRTIFDALLKEKYGKN